MLDDIAIGVGVFSAIFAVLFAIWVIWEKPSWRQIRNTLLSVAFGIASIFLWLVIAGWSQSNLVGVLGFFVIAFLNYRVGMALGLISSAGVDGKSARRMGLMGILGRLFPTQDVREALQSIKRLEAK